MNALQFLNISDLTTLQAVKAEDYPAFSVVLTKLNANSLHPFHKLIESSYDISTGEKIFKALYNISTPPLCRCGSNLNFVSIKKGYNTFCSPRCREDDPNTQTKRELTNLEKFGVKNAGQAEIVKDKIVSTCNTRYGKSSVLGVVDFIEKSKLTRSIQQAETTEKIKATNLEKYGVICSLNNDTVKAKAKITLFEKYGVLHNSQIPEVKEKKRQQLFSFRKKSVFEDEVVALLLEISPNLEIKRNIRSLINPMEIDIWIPSLNLAIECNGCYWHSDPWKPKDYHLIKTEAVEAINAKLIHLLDFEWIHKREIVEHRLRSALGKSLKIYARKCSIRKIKLSEANALISQYHIQNAAMAKHNIGLFFNDELVAVMNFSKPRFNKAYDWELIRYVSKYTIVGGASKLLKFFRTQVALDADTIITYADRRWSNGNVYEKIGFKLLRKSAPGYWYFKGSEYKHRSVFQKHKLESLLPTYDASLGEAENMYANGWRRIFDSGTKVYELVDLVKTSSTSNISEVSKTPQTGTCLTNMSE